MEDSKYNRLKLENQLCFPLYACSRETIRLCKPFLDELDLTYTQYISMLVLWEKRSVTVKELGNHLHLDSGTLTPLLKKLEAKGLLTRRRSTADERNLIVTITPQGEALKEKAIENQQSNTGRIGLTSEEAKILYHLLYKILENVSTDDDQ